ncbi:MAG: glutamate 5-kinase [Woeseiaceae bacterium]
MNSSRTAAHHLESARSVVIKVGSSLLTDPVGKLRLDWLRALSADIAEFREDDVRVTMVTSGAVALGRSVLSSKPLTLPEKQAAAAIGQVVLANAWRDALLVAGLHCAQVLLTPEDTEHRRRHLNARDTLATLAKRGVVAVINENDTVATEELRYGDNDCLAARVAQMIDADLLVLLSDVDGLYDADPSVDTAANHIASVAHIDESMIKAAGQSSSGVGTGGMQSKLNAASIATKAGIPVVVASGLLNAPIKRLRDHARHTLFQAAAVPGSARRRWIVAALRRSAKVRVDSGAMQALNARKSLLPIGVQSIDGEFQRGDCVAVVCGDQEIGVGLVRVSSEEALRLSASARSGMRTDVLMHSDDLVLTTSGHAT